MTVADVTFYEESHFFSPILTLPRATMDTISSSSSSTISFASLSLRVWFNKFSDLLITFDFTSYTADPTILTKKTKDDFIILIVYVNNILVIESDEVNIFVVKTYLQQHLNIHDLRTPTHLSATRLSPHCSLL
ncbi:unnamed protein product [Spirodela intermedia]|uniref:Uncharacterized protein n=2 Tax=Spirodela intermedia TaxID=51605 RepID=A0A7I8KRU0_SPIIN|nr:unnamed protein product [Spirodela intermedia]CAA6664024.1 unnamed protein product [Spirodela intermedia]CAA7400527.1 unnamed protein product [Spirodela intermedia]